MDLHDQVVHVAEFQFRAQERDHIKDEILAVDVAVEIEQVRFDRDYARR